MKKMMPEMKPMEELKPMGDSMMKPKNVFGKKKAKKKIRSMDDLKLAASEALSKKED